MEAIGLREDGSPWDRPATSAFPEMVAWLHSKVRDATLDLESLARPVSQCDLRECGGACCCDGAYLEGDEAEVLGAVVRARASWFEGRGLVVDGRMIVEGTGRLGQAVSPKTSVRSYEGDSVPSAACSFRFPDGRCSLQVLAVESEVHPWHFKPVACWMHPLDLLVGPEGIRIGVFEGAPPPEGSPPSIGSAPCSRREAIGPPAIVSLRREIRFLAGLTGAQINEPT